MTTTAAGSLQHQLDEQREKSAARLGPEIVDTFRKATEELVRSGIAQRALRVGAKAPNLALPNQRRETVQLSDLLARGPVVLSFYRGVW